MKKIRNLAILLSIFITVSSCGTVKEAFSTQKKNSNDEFLVEKKSPLILPPDFNELPEPKSQNSDEDNNQQIKNLINKKGNVSTIDGKGSSSKTFKEHLLGKIKNN
jgi:hypothetical protein